MTWAAKRLGDVVTLKRGHDLPESTRQPGLVPVVSSSGITGYHHEAKAKAPGVVTGRYGTIGSVYYVQDDFWPLNTALYAIDFKANNPRFVAFLLENALRDYESDKAAVPGVDRNVLHELRVVVPPVLVQELIVGVLSAYDDLIENNRRRMVLLEEAARQLYREWFVRLRFPGHEHTRIVDGVPDGWDNLTLSHCATLEDGDWIETKDQSGDEYRVLQISNIGVNEFVETGKFRFISHETFRRLNCREVRPGDILIARMPTPIGRAWLVSELNWKLVTAVDIAIVRPMLDVADEYFLTYTLNSDRNLERCAGIAGGATRLRVTRKQLSAIPVTLPPRRLQQLFREVVEPINHQRRALTVQNQKLRAARDLLLPRLMSGEIAV